MLRATCGRRGDRSLKIFPRSYGDLTESLAPAQAHCDEWGYGYPLCGRHTEEGSGGLDAMSHLRPLLSQRDSKGGAALSRCGLAGDHAL